jgi:pimeloyl-ACP methyl ester carboxylesterase
MVALASVAVVSGCAMSPARVSAPPRSTVAATSTAPTTSTTAPTGTVAPVAWSDCGDDLQCGSVTVPVDYSRPHGPTLEIALERRPASDPAQRIGSLVINPGGPGTSGIDDLPNELSVLTPELLERFDIVSFDPRGVERSDPVQCGPPAPPSTSTTTATPTTTAPPTPVELPDPVPVTVAAQRTALAQDKAYARACEKYSGAILPYVGTVDAARDLDRIRAALGDQKLTFIGHSYGTLLGALYAQMYPQNVRAMVLDGAIDPALSTDQMVLDQAKGFESVLDDFFTWCAANASCPWRPTGDPTTALVLLIDASASKGLPGADGGTAGPGEFYNALLDDLYARSSWPSLGDALNQAAQGNGTDLITLSTSYASGGSTNGADANNAINCLDHPVSRDPATYPGLAATAAAEAPVFGPVLAWGLLQCAVWPVKATRTPAPVSDVGAPPIMVTGTTGDPATPYQWAVSLAGQLSHGELVTWQGVNHVAYFYSPCVRAIDQAYLVDGTLPPTGTVCTD